MSRFQSTLKTMLSAERDSLPDDHDRGYVDAFLREQKKNKDSTFSDEQLVVSVEDFFTGGSGTLSKTLAYAVLYMIKNPQVQDRVRREIREVVGGKQKRLAACSRIPISNFVK